MNKYAKSMNMERVEYGGATMLGFTSDDDRYYRDLLMKELYINLSEVEISTVEEEINKLRSLHPEDESLRSISYAEMYRCVKEDKGSCSYYNSYLIFRLSVQDAVNRLKDDHLQTVLRSIADDVLSNGNILGYKYLMEEYKVE